MASKTCWHFIGNTYQSPRQWPQEKRGQQRNNDDVGSKYSNERAFPKSKIPHFFAYPIHRIHHYPGISPSKLLSYHPCQRMLPHFELVHSQERSGDSKKICHKSDLLDITTLHKKQGNSYRGRTLASQ